MRETLFCGLRRCWGRLCDGGARLLLWCLVEDGVDGLKEKKNAAEGKASVLKVEDER